MLRPCQAGSCLGAGQEWPCAALPAGGCPSRPQRRGLSGLPWTELEGTAQRDPTAAGAPRGQGTALSRQGAPAGGTRPQAVVAARYSPLLSSLFQFSRRVDAGDLQGPNQVYNVSQPCAARRRLGGLGQLRAPGSTPGNGDSPCTSLVGALSAQALRIRCPGSAHLAWHLFPSPPAAGAPSPAGAEDTGRAVGSLCTGPSDHRPHPVATRPDVC